MSRGDLQEMEQSKTACERKFKAADPKHVDNITPGQSAL